MNLNASIDLGEKSCSLTDSRFESIEVYVPPDSNNCSVVSKNTEITKSYESILISKEINIEEELNQIPDNRDVFKALSISFYDKRQSHLSTILTNTEFPSKSGRSEITTETTLKHQLSNKVAGSKTSKPKYFQYFRPLNSNVKPDKIWLSNSSLKQKDAKLFSITENGKNNVSSHTFQTSKLNSFRNITEAEKFSKQKHNEVRHIKKDKKLSKNFHLPLQGKVLRTTCSGELDAKSDSAFRDINLIKSTSSTTRVQTSHRNFDEKTTKLTKENLVQASPKGFQLKSKLLNTNRKTSKDNISKKQLNIIPDQEKPISNHQIDTPKKPFLEQG